jgi:hypothetical protein
VQTYGVCYICSRVYNRDMVQGYISTGEAARLSGMSQAHLRHLLAAGTIKGVKVARDWLVVQTSLVNYMANRPRPGRKPKGSPGSTRRRQ